MATATGTTAKPAAAAPGAIAALSARLGEAVTAVDDAVAGLSGDIGAIQAAESRHVAPLAGRHADLAAAVVVLRGVADALAKLDPAEPAEGQARQ
jgi:hypothetical protein